MSKTKYSFINGEGISKQNNLFRLIKFSAPYIINNIFKKEKLYCDSVGILLCDDNYIRNINKKYLKHDYATDVITFNYEDDLELEADVIISKDTIISNSKLYKVNAGSELIRVIIHAALHICGYNDIKTSDFKKMKIKEDYYYTIFLKKFKNEWENL